MATNTFTSITSSAVILLGLCWCTTVAFALEDVPAAEAPVAAVVSTTSLITATTTALMAEPVKLYKTEFISGNEIAVGDFVVGPGRQEVIVKPGETVTAIMTVTNRITNGRTFSLAVEDMSGSADASEAVVLLGDQSGPYTLKDYISFPSKTFKLDLGERAQIPVSITMPINAEPGGYYGAVLVSTVQDNTERKTDSIAKSPIIARIGTLFFITVPGEADIAGSVTDVSTKNNQWWYQRGPIDFGILFENTGSVHLNPYGEVQVTNMLGENVGFVELEPWFVLPKSLRLREVTWDRELLLGRYTITTKVNRGYNNIVDENTIHIWVLPWKLLLGIFAGLVVLILVVRFFLRSFEFKRKGS